MGITAARRAMFWASNIIFLSALALLFWSEIPPIHPFDSNNATTISATMLGTVATLGGLFSAVYFISLSSRPTGASNSALRRLYPAYEAIVMLAALSGACIIGVISLTTALYGHVVLVLINIQIALTIYVACLIIPIGLRQIENLDTVAVARYVLKKSRKNSFLSYELTEVQRDSQTGYRYELKSDGLNYTRTDPLRPFHDLALLAITSGDRLLLGKLIGELAAVVAKVHGHRWPSDRRGPHDWSRKKLPLRGYLGPNGDLHRIAVSLHIIHYIRNTAKNNLSRQSHYDVGRHACQYHLARIIATLSSNRDAKHVICIAIFAVMHISLKYKDIEPYGRVEPLNAMIVAADLLYANWLIQEAELAASVLGVIRGRTNQLSNDRSSNVITNASAGVKTMIHDAESHARNDPDWLPGLPLRDPWRDHY